MAWATWLTIHITFLIGFRNRFAVFFEWIWNYFTFTRGAPSLRQPCLARMERATRSGRTFIGDTARSTSPGAREHAKTKPAAD